MKTNLSLDDLNAVKASSEAFEFEFSNPDGSGSGLFFTVLGGQSESVTVEVAKLVNARRRAEASREIARKASVGVKVPEFETLENDVLFGQRLAAVRLVGWRGPGETDGLTTDQLERFRAITDPCTPENALRLCKSNREISAQVTLQSDNIANFMKG